ncbi:MAG: NAD(P)H-dependent oxidoreductase [Ginsengibacter sp.]
MKKILAFAGSNSPRSINHQLVSYASSLLKENPTTIISLRDFEMPVFGIEILENEGAHEFAFSLRKLIAAHDAFIISVNEHNQSVSAVFKNTLDWISKAGNDYNVFNGKAVLLLGAAPGMGGAKRAIAHAEAIIDELKGKVVGKFSLPQFHKNVQMNEEGFQIKDESINLLLHQLIRNFEKQLQEDLIKTALKN